MSFFQCCFGQEEVSYETRLVAIPPDDMMAFDESLLTAMSEIKDTLNTCKVDAPAIQKIIMDEIETWEKLRPEGDNDQDDREAQIKMSPSRSFDSTTTATSISKLSKLIVGRNTTTNITALDSRIMIANGYGASVALDFYKVGEYKDPELAYHCFRFTRFVNRGDKKTIGLDMLAQMKVWNGEVLKIRPLRVFQGERAGLRKSERDKNAFFSVSVSGDAIWRDKNEGKHRDGVFVVDDFYAGSCETFPNYNAVWKDRNSDDHKNDEDAGAAQRESLSVQIRQTELYFKIELEDPTLSEEQRQEMKRNVEIVKQGYKALLKDQENEKENEKWRKVAPLALPPWSLTGYEEHPSVGSSYVKLKVEVSHHPPFWQSRNVEIGSLESIL